MRAAIQVVAVLTLFSGLHVAIRMRETLVQHPATGRGGGIVSSQTHGDCTQRKQ
jgi:hypothetical protein